MSLFPGIPAPLFTAPSPVNPKFAFGSLGGRYILLAFLPQPGPEREAALEVIRASAAIFDDDRALFFGVLPDAESYAQARNEPPFRWFSDVDGALRRLYHVQAADGALGGAFPDITFRRHLLEGSLTYPIGPRLAARAFYWYENTRIADWHYTGLAGNLLQGQVLYLDAGPQGYRANVFGLFLQYRL